MLLSTWTLMFALRCPSPLSYCIIYVLRTFQLTSLIVSIIGVVCQAVVVAGKDKGPPLKLDLDITSEELEKKLRECLASRGRKATDPKVTNMQMYCSTIGLVFGLVLG